MTGRRLNAEFSALSGFTPQPVRLLRLAVVLVSALAMGAPAIAQESGARGNDPSDAAMAAYADAANFQTNNALDLAIEAWKTFLQRYPDHPMASKAAHYLGVSYMQQDDPDYRLAANAFRKALNDKEHELREESLANLGWSLYAASGVGQQQRDEALLQQALGAFENLIEENPESRFLDRAYFYSAEAAYALNRPENAIAYYDKLLSISGSGESSLRDDALYGRGIAQEDLQRYEQAMASFRRVLEVSEDGGLKTDVQLRLGDLLVLRERYQDAAELFATAYENAKADNDKAYALFRQAFALVKAERPSEAADKYQQLVTSFPESEYASTATLAAAQSTYRSGDLDLAAERFRKVLESKDSAAATEAAHWLSRIALSKGDVDAAARIAKQRIRDGVSGEFATALRLDLAEALSMKGETLGESLELFEKIYQDAPDDPLAPRALYNAAFSALQLGRYPKAIELADEFLTAYADHLLAVDVRFVGAESRLLAGRSNEAAQQYETLIEDPTAKDHPQYSLWLLRAATAFNTARQPVRSIELLRNNLDVFADEARRAEANFLLGQAYMISNQPAEAAVAYKRAHQAGGPWPRSDEAALLAGQALLASGDRDAAVEDWRRLADSEASPRMADQARYKLAQLASREGDHAAAIGRYDSIIESEGDDGLRPYAFYGKGHSLLQLGEYEQAVESLDKLLADIDSSHPLNDEALLARGMSHRNLENAAAARRDLEAFLELEPRGTNLGHALYELALVKQQEDEPTSAAEYLTRLTEEVQDYPSMDQVLYELGWSLREAGDGAGAAEAFASLVKQYPNDSLAAEAAFFVGQEAYREKNWDRAAEFYRIAAEETDDADLSEKALYRLGWSHFKSDSLDKARDVFGRLAEQHPDGSLVIDAFMMLGECDFKEQEYAKALEHYREARDVIEERGEDAKSLRETSERRVREIVLLHGGQSAAQLEDWEQAIAWYNELRQRFPATSYLPQVFYEIGNANQQLGNDEQALKFYTQVANNFRSEVAARARFMMGEIHFGNQDYDQAIRDYQRVMFGFGAEQAPDAIKNWQARSGFEAGRCAEMLMNKASAEAARTKAEKIAIRFYEYVVEKHPQHELAGKSRRRIEALKQP